VAGLDGSPEDEWEAGPADDPLSGSAEQGLFLSVPAGSFDTDRFAQSGPAVDMPPDPLLATIIDTVIAPSGSGVGALSDDQLIGVIAAARRLESRIAWYQLAAVAEFTARAEREPLAAEFAPDELACELHLTSFSAGAQMIYSSAVAERLPRCMAALFDGRLHPVHLRIVEEETRILSLEDAAKADAVLAETVGQLTYGKTRSAAHRLVLELDPEAAAKRKEAAKRDAHVRAFREDSGNAGMVARELPSAEVLASMQHVEQRALDLRAAGIPGSLQELRVRAYLDLLQERDTRLTQPTPDPAETASPYGTAEPPGPTGPAESGDGVVDGGGPDGGGVDGGGVVDGGVDDGGVDDDAGPPGGNGSDRGGGGRPGADPGPSLAALVTITIPWSAWTGQTGPPAEVDGFGLVDPDEARDLADAAARDPRTRWCVTSLNPDGTAAAHGCAPGRHPPPGPTNSSSPQTGSGPDPNSGPRPNAGPKPNPTSPETGSGPDPGRGPRPNTRPRPNPGPEPPVGPDPREWIRRLPITMTPIARGDCDHDQAETGYRPSRKLRHLVRARNSRCTAPGCNRSAARCDLDHTLAWDDGGLTCECDLAPLCRHHHRCKQAQGWYLEQPEPGILIWHTPAGRTYITRPSQYVA
jgi:hypothetical protein